jgi:hypothetical protein
MRKAVGSAHAAAPRHWQSGRTPALIGPHAVQTIRSHSDRMAVSSGSQSAVIVAAWLHQVELQ